MGRCNGFRTRPLVLTSYNSSVTECVAFLKRKHEYFLKIGPRWPKVF